MGVWVCNLFAGKRIFHLEGKKKGIIVDTEGEKEGGLTGNRAFVCSFRPIHHLFTLCSVPSDPNFYPQH